jgi:hypothetical protein
MFSGGFIIRQNAFETPGGFFRHVFNHFDAVLETKMRTRSQMSIFLTKPSETINKKIIIKIVKNCNRAQGIMKIQPQ